MPISRDQFDEYFRQQEEDTTHGLAIDFLQGTDPKKTAEARRIATKLGVPPVIVEHEPAPYRQQYDQQRKMDVVKATPWLGQSLARNPFIIPVMSAEDVEGVARVGSRLNLPPSAQTRTPPPDKPHLSWTFGRAAELAGGSVGSTVVELAAGIMGGLQLGADYTGLGSTFKSTFDEQHRVADRMRGNFTPEWENQVSGAAAVHGGLTSLGMMLAPLPMGKAKVLSSLVGLTFGTAYANNRARGAGTLESTASAGAQAAIEYATERWGLHHLMGGDLLTSGIKKFAHKIGHYIASEVVGEQLATLGQDAVDTATTGSGKTWAQYWAERPDAALQTLGATLVTGGAVGGLGLAARRMHRTVDANRHAIEGLAGQALLDDVMTRAKDVEFRSHSPDDFAHIVQSASSVVKDVYIPMAAVDAALADDTLPAEEKQLLTLYQDQFDDARVSGGEISVPLGEAVASLAGTKVWEQLKEEVRVVPGGVSGKEARATLEGQVAELESIHADAVAELDKAVPNFAAKQKIYQEVKAGVLAAGRGEKEAQHTAAIYASRAENLASARYGQFKSIEDAWAWQKVQFQKGAKAAKAAVQQSGDPVFNNPLRLNEHTHDDTMWVTPDQYTALALQRKNTVAPRDEPVAKLQKKIEIDGLQSSPYLAFGEGGTVVDQEGLHRAAALKRMGKERIPVRIYGAENLPAELQQYREGVDSGRRDGSRADAPLDGAPKVAGRRGPVAAVVAAARAYASKVGIAHGRQSEYVAVDEERATRIADAYAAMQHDPTNPQVAEAYADLIRQVTDQYTALTDAGFTFSFFGDDSDPYGGSPGKAMLDLRDNKHLSVYATAEGFGSDATVDVSDNPMLAETGIEWPDQSGTMRPVLANDLFRAVHDAFGHGMEGAGFRAQGEENAWQAHAMLFTGPALGALTTETRGQNSWLNYGPKGETNRNALLDDTTFADQKTGLMPEWTWTEGRVSQTDGQSAEQPLVEGEVASTSSTGIDIGWTPERISDLLRAYGYAHEEHKTKAYAVRISPDEFLGLTASAKGRSLIADQVEGGDYGGKIDFDRMRANSQAPFLTIVLEGGFTNVFGTEVPLSARVIGHEGRHRMALLKKAGVTSVPVVIVMQDKGTAPPTGIEAAPQRSRSDQLGSGDSRTMFEGMEPISYANRDQLAASFGLGTVLFQSGMPLFDNPLTVEGKVTVKSIGVAMHADHMAREGRQLFPENDAADYTTVLAGMSDELAAQLEQPNSGVGWYSKDVSDAMELASRAFPTLATNQTHRQLYLTFAGLFSNGSDPDQAFIKSALAFEAYLAKGVIPVTRAEADRAVGNEEVRSKGKDKSGKALDKAAAWSVRDAANQQQLGLVKYIVEREGSLEAGLAWLMSEQPRTAINEAMTSGSGLYKAGRYTTKAEIGGPPALGIIAFGEKLGRYTMGLHGVEIGAEDVTIDLWFIRTYRRLTGRLFETPIGPQGVVGGPNDQDREVIRRLVDDLEKRVNLPTGDVQAALWFFEKRLWGAQGLNTSEGTNSSGARKLLRNRNIYDGAVGDAAGVGTSSPTVAEDADGFPLEEGLSSETDVDPTTFQQFQQGPRGQVSFGADGSSIVQLFGRADFSTLVHETSHVFLQQEFALAQMAGASPELIADVAALKAWMEKNGGGFDGAGMPDRASHELFARTGERYFREGTAPSAELRGAFKQYREWLKAVYKSVKDLLVHGPAPINPEIREIMDRMIATSEAIEDNAQGPMARDELGMDEEEYSKYEASVQAAKDTAHDTLLTRMMRVIKQRGQTEYRIQRGNVRDEVRQDVNNDPRFVALHLLRTGRWLNDPAREATPVKLNTGALIDNYGEGVLKELPVGLQPLHKGDGIDPDLVAEMVGMPSGDALVQALREIHADSIARKAEGDGRPLRDKIVEDETNRIMAERHGDVAQTDEQIREEAIGALNSERQGAILSEELRQLQKKASKPGVVTPYKLLREWARRKANEGTVGDAISKQTLQRYIRNYAKATTALEKALLDGDSAEATIQKQAQLVNHALLAEAKRVADDLTSMIRKLKRLANTKALASIDQDYMDRIHELLEGYNFRPTSARAREERASFETWADAQRKLGHEVYVPERFRDERVPFEQARVEKLIELFDMVSSIEAQGKFKQKLITARDDRERAEIIADIRERVLALPERKMSDETMGDKGRKISRAAAGLVKVESLMDILDGTNDGTGPLNRSMIRPATDAANKYSDLWEQVMAPVVQLMKGMSRKQKARLNQKVTITELTYRVGLDEEDPRIGLPVTVTRMKLLGMLANTGNLSNLAKMVDGEKWGNSESATDMERVRQILLSHATKEDMDLVQSMWDGVQKLWPHIVEVERTMSGIVPEEVVPSEFEAFGVTYSGGYWPVVWDSSRSTMGKNQSEQAEQILDGVGFGISTPKGHTITRTGASAPMEYQLDHVLMGHMNKVVSRIAYAPWVRDALKILNSSGVSGAINLRMGKEYSSLIKPWIRDQIPSNRTDMASAKWWSDWVDRTRVNMSIAVLGVSYSTGIAQLLGLNYSIGTLGDDSIKGGVKWMAVGMREAVRMNKHVGGAGTQAFVFSRSPEMSRRAHEVSAEVVNVMNKLRDDDTVVNRLKAAAFWHIGFIDLNMVSLPTWLGAYHKGLSQGMTDDEASAYGDKAVRKSQGGGRTKDLAAIQRGNAAEKFIALFYTPSSVFFNSQWEGAQQIKAGNWSKALAPTFWFLIMNVLGEAMMNGDWPDDKDEDGLGAMDIGAWAARNMFFGAFYGVPVARDVANYAERKVRGEYAPDAMTTPISALSTAIERGATSGAKVFDPEAEIEGRDIKNMANAVGFTLGLPSNQPGKTAQFAYDYYKGNAVPDGAYDWYSGATSGKLPVKAE